MSVGCFAGEKKLHYLGDGDLDFYKQSATQIDYPADSTIATQEVLLSHKPHRLRNTEKDEIWQLSLAEALQIALSNSEIIRVDAQFLSSSNTLLNNPDQVASIYDPAVQETGVLIGRRGVEAALADFDTQFSTSLLWGRNEQVQNNLFLSGGLMPGDTLSEETGTFTSRLEKAFATGGRFAISHNWNYSGNNTFARLFPSAYTGVINAEYRHPLLAGSGVEFNRIAGPNAQALTSIAGVSQGVIIARINSDISLAEFEVSVRNLLFDVENAYWDLHLAYRVYDSEVVSRNSALQTWQEVKSKFDTGLPGGGTADEAQARDNYYEVRSRAESALSDIYTTETRLRRLLALAVNDGRVIQPVDEPIAAQFDPDWNSSLSEALMRRVELRRQKWNIKSLELQLRAAHSLTKPQLDFISGYQVNAFGDDLIRSNRADGLTANGLGSAYSTLTGGKQTGWNLGFEFEMPIGFRAANAQVRNLELQLAKSRAILSAQELEIAHELAVSFQQIDKWYTNAETNFNRRIAAQTRVEAFEAEYRAGRTNLDLLLRAQISLAQAQIEYYRGLIEYNKAINDLRLRKGSLLEENNIHLSEGLWHHEAYRDAYRRAEARAYAIPISYLESEPEELVVEPIVQELR